MRWRAGRARSDSRSAAAWIQAAAIDRAGDLYRRRADPLRHRLPGQPHDGRRAHAAQALALRDKEGRGLEELRAAGRIQRARSNRSRCPRDGFTNSSSCTSSRDRCSKQEGIDVGLVTHIAAPASMRIVIEGEGGHAGARLMPGRKDALAAAAELILALEAAAKSTGAIDTVGTVGVCEVFPGRGQQHSFARAPGDRHSRHRRRAPRSACSRRCARACADVAARRGVTITTELVNADPPATCDAEILAALEDSAKARQELTRKW